MARLTWLLVSFALVTQAQPLRVFSEFVRFGNDGEPSSPVSPREILSPALARNSFATFQILVKTNPGSPSSLWVGQNPENTFQVTLYRAKGGRLTKLAQPVEIQGTEVIWMDVWVGRETAVARMKLEPELFTNQDWVIYPMEIRVVDAVVPEGPRPHGALPAMEVIRSFTCGTKLEPDPGASGDNESLTPASLSYRNALADIALAAQAPKQELQRIFGPCDQKPFENPESYLRIRDYLVRLR